MHSSAINTKMFFVWTVLLCVTGLIALNMMVGCEKDAQLQKYKTERAKFQNEERK